MKTPEVVAREILQFILRYRRTMPGEATCGESPCGACLEQHLPKVLGCVLQNEPVHFILPAFPCKSPNHSKVLGHLPDMAEQLALEFLEKGCRAVRQIHAPGARITICSDGRVFNDLVGVPDGHVTAYAGELKRMIAGISAGHLDTCDLEDAFAATSFAGMRAQLVREHGRSLEALRALVISRSPLLSAFNGIARFLFEDAVALEGSFKSRSAIRRDSRDLAYQVIQRSLAWSELLRDRFPDAVRLSIHPQACGAEKIGIHLAETRDAWLTPWHAVAVQSGPRFVLMKRLEAERAGAELVHRNRHPSHFLLPQPAVLPRKELCELP